VSAFRRKREAKTGTKGKIFSDYNLKADWNSMACPTSETTQLLRAWAAGDARALDRLTPRVYAELRRIAGHFMRNERPGRSMQATALRRRY